MERYGTARRQMTKYRLIQKDGLNFIVCCCSIESIFFNDPVIWHMRCMSFITKAIDFHSECIKIMAFSRQKCYVISPQGYMMCTLPVFYGLSPLRGNEAKSV
jgi:hypothetical protein